MTSTNWLVLIPIDADEKKFKSFEFSTAIFGVAYHRSRMLLPNIALIGCLPLIRPINILITHAISQNMHIFDSVTFNSPLIHRGYGKIAPFICFHIVSFDELASKMDFAQSTIGIVTTIPRHKLNQ